MKYFRFSTRRLLFEKLSNILVRNENFCTFVPRHEPVCEADVRDLQSFVDNSKRMLVLTGAGVSTESGLPDYRSAEVGLYAKSNHKPMEIKAFLESEAMRKKYWSRNYIAFPRLTRIEPNYTHLTLTKWERSNRLVSTVTQNVDRLHQKSGSKNVIELHGNGYVVKCTDSNKVGCGYKISRSVFQQHLNELNNDLFEKFDSIAGTLRPDMDVDINSNYVQNFKIPQCPQCCGILKPDIIFFGDNVPKCTVEKVYKLVEASDSFLVLGSSLSVFSAYRFVLFANELKKPIAIVNIGSTRADALKLLHINKRCGEILPLLKVEAVS
ncbi:NAD-dependent deacetylase sirtuin-4-like protein [Leptotrombidium deliense]|uniref:NAD-dependent deacetylase sirtuin-4-like protein n=1 Tax=Leptotrombidium deliense TaxID=299467 RepID=A0A443SWG3_9ACAR|nr:NAD-dependent deacetylase sirtuin-4-like protein [Leptotrombidium deliense]